MEAWNKDCYKVVIIMVFIGMINILYYQLYLKRICGKNPSRCDFMNKIVFRVTDGCCSYWSISHFIMYLILGFLFPKCWVLMLIVGIGWEILEFAAGLFDSNNRGNSSIQYSTKWWAPNIADRDWET